MHQTLPSSSKRVVIDTNVLLNAIFVEGGSARHAVDQLIRLGFLAVIDEAIEDEATLVLRRLRIKLGLAFDPVEILRSYIAATRILVLPRAPAIGDKRINRADRHIIGAAAKYKTWVLTGDVKLASQCQDHEVDARLLWDVVMEASAQAKRDPPLEFILQVAGVSAIKGSFFARVVTGDWADKRSVGQFTVCDVENIGRIHYDTDTAAWAFSTVLGYEARLKCVINPGEQWIVAATYDLDGDKQVGSATLRAARPNGLASSAIDIAIKGKFSALNPGQIMFGRSCAGRDAWGGLVQKVVISPVCIDSKGWKALVRVPEAAPDPASANVLETALVRTHFAGGRVTLPTELSFRWSWM